VRFAGALTAAAAVGAVQETMNMVSQEIRETVEQESARLGIDAEFVDREGNPFTEIVKLADDRHADVVVVGASTKAGHRLVGSLAVHLVRTAHWPVTVVP
jgi:nucleotide-binding universal stress UspA family protein